MSSFDKWFLNLADVLPGMSLYTSTSLCHRPRNCNLSNLCGRCKSLAPEIVSWLTKKLQLIQLVWALQEFSARNCELVSWSVLFP